MGDRRQHIVVVDDEADLRASVAEFLELQGFRATAVPDGPGLRAVLAHGQVDLVLLDLRMPGEGGLTMLRELRGTATVPVILVTAMGDPVDRVVGLELGADDYVVKPFALRELMARVRAVLRRTAKASASSRLVRVGCRWFDPEGCRLYAEDGAEVALTAMERDLLKVLVAHANRVLTRDQLLDLAHHDAWEPFDRSIDIRVARLRRKVERDPAKPEAIKTMRGAGYMLLTMPVRRSQAA